MIKMRNKHIFTILTIAIVFVFALYIQPAEAFYFNNAKDALTRIEINTPASHLISFSLSNNEKIEVGYNLNISLKKSGVGFSIDDTSMTTADLDFNDGRERNIVSVDGTCSGFSGSDDIAVGVDGATSTITFTPCSGFVASQSNAAVDIKFGAAAMVGGLGVNRATNPIAPGTYTINIGRNGVSGTNILVIIIADDQLSITGTVDPTIAMFLSTNRFLSFGEVIDTDVRYATDDGSGSTIEPSNGKPFTVSSSTNGLGGITIYMYDQGNGIDSGLWSSDLMQLIPAQSSTDVIAASKSFGTYAKNETGFAIDDKFDNSGTGDGPITLTPQVVAQNNAPYADGSFDIVLKMATDGTTKAGHYGDTITFLCTAIY